MRSNKTTIEASNTLKGVNMMKLSHYLESGGEAGDGDVAHIILRVGEHFAVYVDG
jgi:hypothetical protein